MTQREYKVTSEGQEHSAAQWGEPITATLISEGGTTVCVATLRGSAQHLGTQQDIQGFGRDPEDALSAAYNHATQAHAMREVQQRS